MKVVLLVLVLIAFACLEALIGGTRVLFALPGVSLIALAGILSLWPSLRGNRNFSLAAVASTLVFLGYLLARMWVSPVTYLAQGPLIIAGGCLIIYLLAVFILDRPKERKWLFLTLLIFALAQVIYGFIQFKQGHHTISLPWAARRDDWWRASGFFISPNHFAGYLELMALMAFSFVFWGRLGLTMKVLTAYLGLMCVAGVAMSGSRGGYLSFSAGALVFLGLSLICCWRLFPQRFWVVASVSILGTIVLFASAVSIMLMNTGVRDRLMTVNDPSNVRLQLWDAALQQFQTSPVFGTGSFTYAYYGRLFRDPRVQNDPIHVHNDYLQLLADYGLIAAGLFLLVYGAHVFAGVRGFRQLLQRTFDSGDSQSDGLALSLGALSGLTAFTVHSVVDFNMHITVNALLMTLLLAILASPMGQGDSANRVSWALGNFFRWILLPLSSVALLVHILPSARAEWQAEQARVALRDYRLEDALRDAKLGIKEGTSNFDLYYYAGEAAREMAAQKMGDPVQLRLWAAHYFTQGLKLYPADSRTAVKLAHAYSDMGRYDEALRALELAEEWDPHSSFPIAYRGLVEWQASNPEAAEEYFREALSIDRQNTVAQQGLKALQPVLQKLKTVPTPAPASSPAPASTPVLDEEIEDDTPPAPPEAQFAPLQ